MVREVLAISIGLLSRDDSKLSEDPDEKAELGPCFLLFERGESRVIWAEARGSGTEMGYEGRGRAEMVASLLVSRMEIMAVPRAVSSFPSSILLMATFDCGESRQRLE